MKSERVTTTLGNLLSLSNGKSSPERSNDLPYPVYGGNGVIGFSDQANSNPGTIIIGRVGSYCGSVHFSDSSCWVTDNAILAKAMNGNDAKFIFYLLHTLRLNDFRVGSGQPLLNQTILSQIPATIPGPSEQRRIAHILGTLDDKIELNRQINETLETTARAIFKSWFVDFDPVKAKMEGHKPPCMDAKTAALFPSAFQDSPRGKIPEGWKVGTLGKIAKNIRRSVKASEIDSSECFIGLEHMPRRNIALSQWQIDAEIASNKYRLRKGEILFGKLNPHFHKVGVAPIDGICSTDILVVQPIDAEWFGVVLSLVSSDNFVAYTTAFSKGTTLPRTNWKDMSNYKTVLPKIEIAQKYTEFIQPIIKRIIENIHQSHTLAQTRDTLLPKLLSGKIRVDDAAEILEKI